jgi:MerR family redox-sensitive transcriptional activator SoxR
VLTIGEVASRAGVRPSAIRYYEEIGLLPKAIRRSGTRVYDASVFKRLAVIDLAKTAGFELKAIRSLLSVSAPPPVGWRALAGTRRAQVDAEIVRLRLTKSILKRIERCGCATLADCASAFDAAKAKYVRFRR